MRGVYRAAVEATGVTTAKTLLVIGSPSSKVLEILSARITAQDEDTSEQILAELNRISSIGTPTFEGQITPYPTEEGSSASSVIASGTVTASEPTYDSSSQAVARGGANKLIGWEYIPLPEERAYLGVSDYLGLRLIDDLGSATDLTAEITYREIG